MERKGDGSTSCNRCLRINPKRIGKKTVRFGIKRASGDHLDNRIIKIRQNTEKCSEELEETYCHSASSEKPSANAGVKKSQKSKIITIVAASVGYMVQETKPLTS